MHISDIKSNTLRRVAVVLITPPAVVAFTALGLAEAMWRAGVAFYDTAKDYGSEVKDIVSGARTNWQPK